jgi:DNA-binding CsgD family transcriptional regulator
VPYCLSSKDYRTLLDTIELAYSIPDCSTMILDVFKKIEEWIGISGGVFLPLNIRTGDFFVEGTVPYNCDAESVSLFFSYYAPIHPLVKKNLHVTHINRPNRLTDFVPACRLQDTEYGRDFQPKAQIFYELSMPLGSQGNPIAGLALHRNKHEKDFTDRDIAIMNFFVPHLANAIHNINLMETIVLSQDVGLIIIGTGNTPLFINDIAKQALSGMSAAMIPDPGLSAYPVYFKSNMGTYRVQTKTVRPGIKEKVILLEPVPSQNHLRMKLADSGLTPRQEEIAVLVIRGYSNREIAEKLYITEQTVKDHLRDVFAKMKIHKRNELTAKVLGISY